MKEMTMAHYTKVFLADESLLFAKISADLLEYVKWAESQGATLEKFRKDHPYSNIALFCLLRERQAQ